MERETKIIHTPLDNHEVVLKSWLTAREKRSISTIYLDNTHIRDEGKVEVSGKLLSSLQDEQVNVVVISINSSNENILDTCLEMKSKDYEYIMNEIGQIVNPASEESKKK